jgi:hypothetical protein
MSRGLGKLQRDLLEILEVNTGEIDTLTLAALAYQAEPGVTTLYRDRITDAHHAAVRRALRNLHKRGLVVELGRRYRCNCCHWASLKDGLPMRLRYLRDVTMLSSRFGSGTRAEAEARATEMVEIQERMKQLGIELTDRPSRTLPQIATEAAV